MSNVRHFMWIINDVQLETCLTGLPSALPLACTTTRMSTALRFHKRTRQRLSASVFIWHSKSNTHTKQKATTQVSPSPSLPPSHYRVVPFDKWPSPSPRGRPEPAPVGVWVALGAVWVQSGLQVKCLQVQWRTCRGHTWGADERSLSVGADDTKIGTFKQFEFPR